jgi:hypothetical protein
MAWKRLSLRERGGEVSGARTLGSTTEVRSVRARSDGRDGTGTVAQPQIPVV